MLNVNVCDKVKKATLALCSGSLSIPSTIRATREYSMWVSSKPLCCVGCTRTASLSSKVVHSACHLTRIRQLFKQVKFGRSTSATLTAVFNEAM